MNDRSRRARSGRLPLPHGGATEPGLEAEAWFRIGLEQDRDQIRRELNQDIVDRRLPKCHPHSVDVRRRSRAAEGERRTCQPERESVGHQLRLLTWWAVMWAFSGTDLRSRGTESDW